MSGQSPWQQALAEAITCPSELLHLLRLPQQLLRDRVWTDSAFPLRVPRGYAALMRPADPDDPLLRQVLPLQAEKLHRAGFVSDPVGDGPALRAQGLLQKYPGRALLITTGACAIHCRYCFRRHFPYQTQQGLADRWRSSLEQLRQDATAELVLSGGDPLTLSNARLRDLLLALQGLPDLRRLRLHSRLPLVLPERIDSEFIELGGLMPGRPILVIHCNHPQELGEAARSALQRLQRAGWVLYNQSVLLRGVNDSAATLAELSERLFDLGVQPYYLHQLDPVQGAAHFALSDEQARRLQRQLLGRLPGYLVPRLVREIPGEMSKTPL
ncbi:EF-P beta-lysylation protein EpmB [Magnetovirga frankeli]|nr:EF-P beta-lysylation protein EpmB [gamma proteobacterium SS-5]